MSFLNTNLIFLYIFLAKYKIQNKPFWLVNASDGNPITNNQISYRHYKMFISSSQTVGWVTGE